MKKTWTVLIVGLLLVTLLVFPLFAETVHCNGPISVFFATPSNDTVDEELCSVLQTATHYVMIAMYSFTLPNVAHTLERLTQKGVTIQILMEKAAPGGNAVACAVARSNPLITLREVSEGGIFHHKFAVIDASVVITGSFNWSDNAQDDNWENLNVIDCPELANLYHQQFTEVWVVHSSPGCAQAPQSFKVNINTASKSELMSLPGIAEGLSKRIIDYRNTYGNFSRIEDIMNVPYIGDATFAKIKDLICVGWDCGK